jgi:hypothetical protein
MATGELRSNDRARHPHEAFLESAPDIMRAAGYLGLATTVMRCRRRTLVPVADGSRWSAP